MYTCFCKILAGTETLFNGNVWVTKQPVRKQLHGLWLSRIEQKRNTTAFCYYTAVLSMNLEIYTLKPKALLQMRRTQRLRPSRIVKLWEGSYRIRKVNCYR